MCIGGPPPLLLRLRGPCRVQPYRHIPRPPRLTRGDPLFPPAAWDRKGREVASTDDKDLVEDFFIMEKLTKMPPFIYQGWRMVALYEKTDKQPEGQGVAKEADSASGEVLPE